MDAMLVKMVERDGGNEFLVRNFQSFNGVGNGRQTKARGGFPK